MKNLVFIVLFVTQFVFSQSFEQGNALYRKGNFTGAAQQYEGVLKQGKTSFELYFNLGNAYFKQEKVAPAIYNYEKALLLDPRNKEVTENLVFANKLVIDDIAATPKTGLSKVLYNATGKYHYDTWAWIAISFSGLCLLLFIGYYLIEATVVKRIFFTGMFVALLGVILSVLAAAFVRSQQALEHPAIVFAEVAPVKTDPSEKAKDVFILHEGTKVNVSETKGSWKKVVLPDDSVGWIDKNAIKELK
jgi:tetratricopeptide (TPR) repeat protein